MNRRKFLLNSTKTSLGLSFLGMKPIGMNLENFYQTKNYTVQEIINLILKEGNLSPKPNTVDTVKIGNSSQGVSGIVITMFPTISIIERAIALKSNFIIAHEPSFYNHEDHIDWVPNNAVLQEKIDLLDKNKIIIWRFHDYCHSLKPDPMLYGIIKKMGWEPYYKPEESIIQIPNTSLQALIDQLKRELNISHLRIIGDLGRDIKKVGLLPGAAGGQNQVGLIEKENPDVLIVGELSEWETAEYLRDRNSFGKKTALIILGHSLSEEAGMEYFTNWLQPKIPSLNITHVPSGDPFTWL
jgi:putative NIF3 family GTP cyclohydrolase 1 type 2